MHEDLKGKTAVVTGAGKTSGIGYAVAERLASLGGNVVIADLGRPPDAASPVRTGTRSEMEAIAAELGGRYGVQGSAVEADVTDPASVARMAGSLRERCGHVHILVNNAGASFGVPADILSYDEEEWIRTVDVCLFSVFRVSRAVLPLMLGEPGAIVNTASRAGKVPPLFNNAYAAAKAGVIMLTKTMARELAPRGIRVNAICPGQIRTDLEQWRFGLEASFFGGTVEEREAEMCKTIPLGRIGDPEDAGRLVAFLVSDASRYITGQAFNLDGGQCMEL
ncbi:MAG: SDR family oxidoreductase [Proteobacteria bacterium]|nr:SDR family oxidoreductase [Pseudomonadota bacterium]